jgi:predicted dehydrogenase
MASSSRPIVIIGAGGIVRDAHLPAYSKAGLRVAAICDLVPGKARELAARFGIPRAAADVRDLIENAPSGAVFDVAVPASEVLPILKDLPDGAAALIQKPLGENLAQARAIRELCRARRLTAAVNFQLRFAPAVEQARRLITEGRLGTLTDIEVRVTCYTPWEMWPFLENAPRVEIIYHSVHHVDLIRSFCGDPSAVYAKTLKHPRAPKLASTRSTIILDYGDSVRANITANHAHAYGPKHQESYIKWEGTRGAIKTRMGVLLDYPHGMPDAFEYVELDGSERPEWKSLPLDGTWFPDAFWRRMANLMAYLDGTSPELAASVEDACRTMAVVESAYASSESGGIPVAYD